MLHKILFIDPKKRGSYVFIYYLHLLFFESIKSSNDCLIPKIKSLAANPSEFVNNPQKYLNDYFQSSQINSAADLNILLTLKDKIKNDPSIYTTVQINLNQAANELENKINDVVLKEINNEFNNFLDEIKYGDIALYNEIINNTNIASEVIKTMADLMSTNENKLIIDSFITLKVKEALEIGKIKQGFSKVKNFFVNLFNLNDASLENDKNLSIISSYKTIDQCFKSNNPVLKPNTRYLPTKINAKRN